MGVLMGGVGSGRGWCWCGRDTTDTFRSIDVRRWRREGLLEPGRAFGWQWTRDSQAVASIRAVAGRGEVRLVYRQRAHGSEWQAMDYPVRLSWTDCHLGGARPWFLCPARGCGQRVAILYGGAVFACRKCHQLAYPSQSEGPSDRAARRAERIRSKLDWPPGILNGAFGKPRGMHWRTFHRLYEEHDDWASLSLAYVERRLLSGGLDYY